MKVFIKCQTEKEVLENKHKIHKDVELQLRNEFDGSNKAIDVFNKIKEHAQFKIGVVHAPLIEGSDLNIEYVGNYRDRYHIWETISLAHLISEENKDRVRVVLHTTFDMKFEGKFPIIMEQIIAFFDEIFYRYPNVDFLFENVVPFLNGEDGSFRARNGCFDDTVLLAKRLNGYFGGNRFGTVLDTCHAKVTMTVMNRHSDYYNLSMEDFFRVNGNLCRLIHLADVIDVGYRPNQHGVLITDENFMKEVLRLRELYTPNADITIEIKEDNYINCSNFIMNYEMLNRNMEIINCK